METVALSFKFNHVSYTPIIHDICGEARDGQMMAVMGASGSGKSTLIDALANRIAKGSLKGSITLNGQHLESPLQKAISAYVMQHDLLFPTLTVQETLMFAAHFKLPASLSASHKRTRVQALIHHLALQNAANTLIGDHITRGVSGGERRRVSIGVDIINDPILLFLDEPTSGLDSTSAFTVVKVLQRIAQTRRSIVILSIHQPSNRILQLLDHLIILSTGKTVYSGPPSHLPLFFLDFGHPIPDGDNKVEFALDLIRELETSPDGIKSLVDFNQCFNKPNHPVLPLRKLELSTMPEFANSRWIEVRVLMNRSFINLIRKPKDLVCRVAIVVITGFLFSTMFFNLDNSRKGINERLGFFCLAMTTTLYSCVDSLPMFLHERNILMRETAYNSYRRSSYVLSTTLVVLPLLLFFSLVFCTMTFFSIGLNGSFVFYLLIMFASFWTGSSFVTLVSGIVPNVVVGYIAAVSILGYFLLFSGFIINRDRIPVYWVWSHYISIVKYLYEAVLQNEFDNSAKCVVRGVDVFDGIGTTLPEAVKDRLNISGEMCIMKGMEMLVHEGVSDLNKWNCLWVTLAWGFLFRILFYFTLLLGSKTKRT